MRVKDTKSLLWLSRWYNGRSDRLGELHDEHCANLAALVRERLGKRKHCHRRRLDICGIKVVVSLSEHAGLQLHAIGPPQTYSGLQRNLFAPLRGRARRKLTLQEVQHGIAA